MRTADLKPYGATSMFAPGQGGDAAQAAFLEEARRKLGKSPVISVTSYRDVQRGLSESSASGGIRFLQQALRSRSSKHAVHIGIPASYSSVSFPQRLHLAIVLVLRTKQNQHSHEKCKRLARITKCNDLTREARGINCR
jgi:hypothetical protein